LKFVGAHGVRPWTWQRKKFKIRMFKLSNQIPCSGNSKRFSGFGFRASKFEFAPSLGYFSVYPRRERIGKRSSGCPFWPQDYLLAFCHWKTTISWKLCGWPRTGFLKNFMCPWGHGVRGLQGGDEFFLLRRAALLMALVRVIRDT